jgi:hypothetical protein
MLKTITKADVDRLYERMDRDAHREFARPLSARVRFTSFVSLLKAFFISARKSTGKSDTAQRRAPGST